MNYPPGSRNAVERKRSAQGAMRTLQGLTLGSTDARPV